MDAAWTPDAESLLEERAWVRRLARALCADAASADDLEQDAWIAALRSPPSRRERTRAWFRAVLRRRVFEIHRGDVRRRAREAATARGERTESTDEIVARAEAHRRIVEAVFALDEPLRTTVVLRHFEDLPTAEIAARSGVAADTVRARLRRAHAELRSRLGPAGERGRGARTAWALVLAGPAPALIRRLDSSGGAAVSGSVKKALLAAACLLAGAGAVVWSLTTGGEGDGADVGRGPAEHAPPAGTQDAGGDAPGAAGRAAASSAAPAAAEAGPDAARIQGDVRFVAGDAPAAGVSVVLRTARGVVRTETDALGAFQFHVRPEEPCAVEAAAPGCADARQRGMVLAPRETRRLGTLWLDEPSRIGVRVTGPGREPVAGAAVEVFRERRGIAGEDWAARLAEPETTATTGDNGRAALDGIGVGRWTVRAICEGLAPGSAETVAILRGGVSVEVEIALSAGHVLTGTITRADGSPLADTLVLALPPVLAQSLMTPVPVDPRGVETRTDAAGAYRFAALPAGDHSLAILRPGSLPCRIGIVSIPSVSHFDVRLDGAAVSGRVTEEGTGRPIEGARVRGAAWRRHSPTFLSVVTDAEGRYTLDVPLAGILQGPARGDGEAAALPVHFDVQKDGWVYVPETSATPWRTLWVLGGRAAPFDVVLRRAASLSGTVTGPGGPVAGAEVLADVWNPVRGSLPSRTTTDASGRYRFGGLADGRARIAVTHPGHAQAASPGAGWRSPVPPDPATVVEIPRTGDVTFDVTLLRGVAVRGRVLGRGGAPLQAASVVADDGAGLRRETTTGADGVFETAGLRPGTEVTVRASAAGHADGEVRIAIPAEGEAAPADVQLTALGIVRGRVEGPAGPAPDGAWVQVAPARLALDTGYEVFSVWHECPRLPVAPDGTFAAPAPWKGGAAAEGIVVRAGAPGLAPALSSRLPAPTEGDADAGTLRLETGHRLTGRVVAADGSGPVANAEVEFMNETLPPALGQRRDWSAVGRDMTPFEWVARTGADGTFAIDGLPAWRYELRVNAEGFDGEAPTVAVPQEDALTVEMTRLRPIRGRVEFADGAPGTGIVVVALRQSEPQGPAGQTETAPDGSFELPHVGAGRYVLEARRAWDRTIDVLPTRSAEVEAGAQDVVIVARRGGGAIAGRCIVAGGAPVPGAVLHLKPARGGPLVHARSAPDGRFEVAGLEAAAWTITAEASRSVGGPEGFGRRLVATSGEVALGSRDVVLEFRAPAPIGGKVVRDDGTPPAGRLLVQARAQPDGKWTLFAQVAADGTFDVVNATEGPWSLVVIDAATGAELRTRVSQEVRGGMRDVRLVIAATAALAGRVVDERGRPVEGAVVTAAGGATTLRPAVTDRDGRFQWTAVEPGRWTVVARHDATGRADAADLAPGGPETTLTLRAAVPVEARIVAAADGTPLRSAIVVLVDEDGRDVARLRTDSDGRFATRSLAAGVYSVRVVERDGAALPEPLTAGTVRAGDRETVLRI